MHRLLIALVVIQVIDVVIHAASDQLEPLRVASNLLIIVWAAVAASGRVRANVALVNWAVIGAYLVLNLIFLAAEGVVNPNTGEVRTVLFALVALTLALGSGVALARPSRS